GAGGGSTSATTTATVDNAALTPTTATVSATEGTPFTGAIAGQFADANSAASAGDFTATIHCGDGSSSAGTVAANVAGGFDVTGTHTYVHSGPKHPTVTVTGLGGGSAAGNGTVNVANATLTASGQVKTAVEGTAFSGTLGSFTDSNASASASD